MPQATALWSLWRRLLQPFACIFTRPGHRRFVEWVTALARNVEEHTVTQSAVAVERLGDWRAWERFAASGAWDPAAVTRRLTRAVEEAPGRTWHGDHVWAGDDTKVHRSGQHVWGTCTFHEDTARGPNRATTVRAHHGVVRGAPRDHGERPAWFLPLSGRLSFRQSQLPARSGVAGPKEVFRTRCERAGALVRERARISGGRHLAVFDGGSALKSVVRPPVVPEEGPPRVESLTRSRHDARLQAPPPKERRPGQRGPTPRWGKRRPPPRQGGWWKKGWQEGRSSI
ncbi:MAG: transposase [Solirubrobacterales bacterium]|nr:transposase [Solirubrobacterales bacterium]